MKKGRMNGKRSALRAMAAALSLGMFLSLSAPAVTVQAENVNDDGVNVRSEPSSKGGVIGLLYKSDKFTVIGEKTDKDGNVWVQIRLKDDRTGYVSAQFVDGYKTEAERKAEEEKKKKEEEKKKAEEEAKKKEEEEKKKKEEEEKAAAEASRKAEEEAAAEESRKAAEEAAAEEASRKAAEEAAAEESRKAAEEAAALTSTESTTTTTTLAPATGADAALTGDEAKHADSPWTDPNASYNLQFDTDEDGVGNWYVYNYDTGTRLKLADLQKMNELEAQATAGSRSASVWRVIAIVLGILLIALAAFLLLIIRRNTRGRGPSRREKARERIAQSRRGSRRRSYDDDLEGFEEEPADYADEEDDIYPSGGHTDADEAYDEAYDDYPEEEDGYYEEEYEEYAGDGEEAYNDGEYAEEYPEEGYEEGYTDEAYTDEDYADGTYEEEPAAEPEDYETAAAADEPVDEVTDAEEPEEAEEAPVRKREPRTSAKGRRKKKAAAAGGFMGFVRGIFGARDDEEEEAEEESFFDEEEEEPEEDKANAGDLPEDMPEDYEEDVPEDDAGDDALIDDMEVGEAEDYSYEEDPEGAGDEHAAGNRRGARVHLSLKEILRSVDAQSEDDLYEDNDLYAQEEAEEPVGEPEENKKRFDAADFSEDEEDDLDYQFLH